MLHVSNMCKTSSFRECDKLHHLNKKNAFSFYCRIAVGYCYEYESIFKIKIPNLTAEMNTD